MRPPVFPVMVGLLLLSAVPVALAAGQATVEAPIQLDGVTAEMPSAQIYLHGGQTSIVFPQPAGAIDVWTYRVPCFNGDENTCLEGSGERSREKIDATGGSVTVLPNEDASRYEAYVTLDEGSQATLSADRMVLDLLEENRTRDLHDDAGRAPDAFNQVALTEGTLARFTEGLDLSADGRLTMSVANATVVAVDGDGEQRRFETGWTWEDSERQGFQDRVLRLVNIVNTGELSADWDGNALISPALPLGLQAEQATMNITDGNLGDQGTGDQVTIQDLQATVLAATVTGGSSDGSSTTGTFELQDGLPAPDSPTPEEDNRVSTMVIAGASAAALALVGAVAYYWPRLSWGATVLGLPMYSRIERSELLDNDTREELYEAVKDQPGIHAHALSQAVEIGWGTTVYHLRRLEKNGMVTSEKRGRYRRFFPAAGYVARTREILSVLQNETTNDIARTVLKEPGLNQKAICEKLDISPSLANWHIKRLVEADLVEKERRGRTVHYTPGKAWDEVGDELEMAVS